MLCWLWPRILVRSITKYRVCNNNQAYKKQTKVLEYSRNPRADLILVEKSCWTRTWITLYIKRQKALEQAKIALV